VSSRELVEDLEADVVTGRAIPLAGVAETDDEFHGLRASAHARRG
jgi:hypothetical protein